MYMHQYNQLQLTVQACGIDAERRRWLLAAKSKVDNLL